MNKPLDEFARFIRTVTEEVLRKHEYEKRNCTAEYRIIKEGEERPKKIGIILSIEDEQGKQIDVDFEVLREIADLIRKNIKVYVEVK